MPYQSRLTIHHSLRKEPLTTHDSPLTIGHSSLITHHSSLSLVVFRADVCGIPILQFQDGRRGAELAGRRLYLRPRLIGGLVNGSTSFIDSLEAPLYICAFEHLLRV